MLRNNNALIYICKFYKRGLFHSLGAVLVSIATNCLVLTHWTEVNYAVNHERARNFCSSRDTVVGRAIGYGMDGQGVGVRAPVGSRIFFSP
jgi:hypothetical protein